MTRTERIQKIMDKYEISAKIGFGQNFLMDDKAIEKMEEAIFSFNNPIIAEIGCGLGSLTFGLVNKAEKVIGHDIDKDMLNVLRNEMTYSNFELREEDFLKADISDLAEKKAFIAGNLPYNITKRILEKIIAYPYPFCFGIMVQKEVATKLTYVPSLKSNCALGAYLYLHGNVNLVVDVPAKSFVPAPKVNSAFITYKAKDCCAEDYGILKKIFMAENKSLTGYLSKQFHFDKTEIEKILVSPSRRCHELTKEELIGLIYLFKNK